MTEIKVPTLGESVTEATVATWFKSPGDTVAIYYLKSDGVGGEVGVGAIDGSTLSKYTTTQFLDVFNDIKIKVKLINLS